MSQQYGEWTYIHEAARRNEFFGEVKYRATPSGDYEVGVVVMPDPKFGFELSMAALAVDGSKSMMEPFAAHLPMIARKKRNEIHDTAQDLALHLAKNAHGRCALAYWACKDDGGDIEPIGILTTEELKSFYFEGPQNWGGGTKMTPIVRYFWEQVFVEADSQGVAAILTDGAWDDQDHAELLQLTQTMCEEVAAGQRPLMKVCILGLKTKNNAYEIDRIESRFNDLDDFESGTDVDVWDHKWVHELSDWNQIFIEMVKEMPLGLGGQILDATGNQILARDEFNFGIEFTMPGNSPEFTLTLEGAGEFKQAIG